MRFQGNAKIGTPLGGALQMLKNGIDLLLGHIATVLPPKYECFCMSSGVATWDHLAFQNQRGSATFQQASAARTRGVYDHHPNGAVGTLAARPDHPTP